MRQFGKNPVFHLVIGGLTAGLYVLLTLTFSFTSFHMLQFRLSEALCVLPMFTPAAIPGLFIGCALSNLIGGVWFDAVFGALATLLGALGTYALRKTRPALALSPPVFCNALIIPFVLRYGYGAPDLISVMFFSIIVEEALVIYGVGLPLYYILRHHREFRYHLNQ